jgi:hypothetical protein
VNIIITIGWCPRLIHNSERNHRRRGTMIELEPNLKIWKVWARALEPLKPLAGLLVWTELSLPSIPEPMFGLLNYAFVKEIGDNTLLESKLLIM